MGWTWSFPPQFQDGIDVHIVVVETEGMGGVEGLDVLYPPQEDCAVDPAVNVLDPLDHSVNVAASVSVGNVSRVFTAFGNQVPRHGPHYDRLQTFGCLDEGEDEDEQFSCPPC